MDLYEIIPRLKISPQGIFKYILIQAKIQNKDAAIFIRGDKKHQYHADNYKAFRDQLKGGGFTDIKKKQQKIYAMLNGEKITFTCLGGGRIEHNYKDIKCSIYGYSKGFGYVDHKIARKIVVEDLHYPEETIILDQKQY